MSVQWIACPDCAFKLPYAILGKKGSFRTGREFATLCRHLSDPAATDALECPVLRAEAEGVLKIRLAPATLDPPAPLSPLSPKAGEDSDE
jgi:hypothetical protein